jgi:hypothetical protein
MATPKKAVPATKPRITAAHKADMQMLGEALLEAAIEHELCDEFYDVLAKINDTLTVPLVVKTPKKKLRLTYSLYVDIDAEDFKKGEYYGDDEFSEAQKEQIEAALSKSMTHLDFVTDVSDIELDGTSVQDD